MTISVSARLEQRLVKVVRFTILTRLVSASFRFVILDQRTGCISAMFAPQSTIVSEWCMSS